MKNKITFGIALSILLASCSTSNEVASNKRIQKRKYNKGFHIELDQNIFKKSKHQKDETETIANNHTTTYQYETTAPQEEIASNDSETSATSTNVTTVSHSTEEAVLTDLNTADTRNLNNPNETVVTNEETVNETPKVIQLKPKKNLRKQVKMAQKNVTSDASKSSNDDMLILLVILCFLLPFLAVGLKTNWDITKVLITILLSIFFWVPGIIYALLIVLDVI